jgi:hypothetical protein
MVATDFVLHFLRIFHIFSTWRHQQIGGFSSSEPRPACASKWSSATSCCLTSHRHWNILFESYDHFVKSLEVAVYQHTRINILIHLQFMNILWTYFWQFKTCNFFTCCEIRGGYFFFAIPMIGSNKKHLWNHQVLPGHQIWQPGHSTINDLSISMPIWLVVSTYPSEKYESQLGWWHSQQMET